MSKQLRFNTRAQYSIKKGLDTLAKAVRVTIGPRGRNVVLDHILNGPSVLNDRVTIARGIDLEEPFTNMVVQLLKEAAIKTNDMAGDGTTTATILVQAIFAEGLKNMTAGANPMMVRIGLELGLAALMEEIKAMSKLIKTREEIVLLVGNYADQNFIENDLKLFLTIGQQLGLAIKNTQLQRSANEMEALREADRLKSGFLAAVSHDLRSPLTAIRASVESLLDVDGIQSAAGKDHLLHNISGQANRLGRLVDQLLDLSRIEAGVLSLDC